MKSRAGCGHSSKKALEAPAPPGTECEKVSGSDGPPEASPNSRRKRPARAREH